MAASLPAPENAKPDKIGQGIAAAAQARTDWRIEDTEAWLTDYPLPATFKWNGTRAYPRYTAKKGYGFWLRTAGPYHPALRGLFMLCHHVLAGLRPGVDLMPTPEQLAALLVSQQRPAEQLPWSAEDRATIAPDALNPAENVPSPPDPSCNPAATQRQPSGNPAASQRGPPHNPARFYP